VDVDFPNIELSIFDGSLVDNFKTISIDEQSEFEFKLYLYWREVCLIFFSIDYVLISLFHEQIYRQNQLMIRVLRRDLNFLRVRCDKFRESLDTESPDSVTESVRRLCRHLVR